MRSRPAIPRCIPSQLTSPATILLKLFLLLLSVSTASQLHAQTPSQQTAPPPEAPYTLHIYTNLIQIPTLVLSSSFAPLPPVSLDKFNISVDSGPPFHPTDMHMEGDDPIDLAILLDLSSGTNNLQSAIANSISDFVAHSLQPHDHISIYALDCAFVRTANNVPAVDGNVIARDVNNAIHAPELHDGKKGPHCSNSLYLWDALAKVAETISSVPGRRVILTLTAGQDKKSSVPWKALTDFLQTSSITVFGLNPEFGFGLGKNHPALDSDDPFSVLCELSGGVVFFTDATRVHSDLQYVISLLRGRYILEFPEPDNTSNNGHIIDVTIAKTDAFIRTTGVSLSQADPALFSAPSTIPSSASPAAIGNRHSPPPHL